MRHLDLFSGIGGFALAASWVWPDHEVVAFCDIDPYATKVLNRHWPDVPVINDVRNITKDTIDGPVHLITGGFPCQPFSQAGKRQGKDDDRYLWPEMLRVITEFRPRFVLGENVSGIYTIDEGMVFDKVCADLEHAGYEVWPIRVPAAALNAPHRRDRWWFAAYATDTTGKRSGTRANRGRFDDDPEGEKRATAESESERGKMDGRTGTDHSAHPHDAPYHNNTRLQGGAVTGSHEQDGPKPDDKHAGGCAGWDRHWLEVAAQFCRVDDGLSDRMDTSDRKHRLKALGNAIVPQVAAQIMQAMKDADMGVSVRSESDG